MGTGESLEPDHLCSSCGSPGHPAATPQPSNSSDVIRLVGGLNNISEVLKRVARHSKHFLLFC